MNCGVCTATCPLGIDVLPRQLLRYAALGMEERIRAGNRNGVLVPAVSCLRGELPSGRAHHREHPPHASMAATGGMLMSLPIRDVVGILGDNLRLRGSVLPISAKNATRWTRGLELAPRWRDRALHRPDVPADPVHRAARGGAAAPRRLAAGEVHRVGPPRQPTRQHLGVHGPAVEAGARGLRRAFRAGSCAFCARPASSSALCTKTTSTPERSPTTSGSTSSSLRTPGACTRACASTA